jgi:predicted transcriptional regulator
MSKAVLVGKVVEAISTKKDVPFVDIVTSTGLDRRQLSTVLAQLIRNGRIVKTDKGYALNIQ